MVHKQIVIESCDLLENTNVWLSCIHLTSIYGNLLAMKWTSNNSTQELLISNHVLVICCIHHLSVLLMCELTGYHVGQHSFSYLCLSANISVYLFVEIYCFKALIYYLWICVYLSFAMAWSDWFYYLNVTHFLCSLFQGFLFRKSQLLSWMHTSVGFIIFQWLNEGFCHVNFNGCVLWGT
jgi:hypothetical protein